MLMALVFNLYVAGLGTPLNTMIFIDHGPTAWSPRSTQEDEMDLMECMGIYVVCVQLYCMHIHACLEVMYSCLMSTQMSTGSQ